MVKLVLFYCSTISLRTNITVVCTVQYCIYSESPAAHYRSFAKFISLQNKRISNRITTSLMKKVSGAFCINEKKKQKSRLEFCANSWTMFPKGG